MRPVSLVLPSVCLLLTGCSGPGFAYNTVDPKGLTGLRTLALAPPAERVMVLEGMHPVPTGYLQGLVLEAMQAKGYVQASSEAADLLLRVYLFAEGNGGRGEGAPQGPHRGMGSEQGGAPVGNLSLVVHLVSREGGKLVWGGTLEYPASRRQKGGPGVSELIRQFLQPLPAVK